MLTYRECERAFTFAAGAQASYLERGYSEPQRGASCRVVRKAHRVTSGCDSGSSRSGFSSGGYDSGPRQLYLAVCSSGGSETEVPFSPRSDKPV